jgi:hypothetical protein
MNEKNYINFNIFCQRKNFNLEQHVKLNLDLDYFQLKEFFLKRKVMPPSKEVFLKIRNNILLQDVKTKEEVLLKDEKLDIKEEQKKTKKVVRRRKKKNEQA